MKQELVVADTRTVLEHAAAYGAEYRLRQKPLHPTATVEELRKAFLTPLPEHSQDGTAVINDLIAAAEPGLVGNTDPNFFAWVMGSSDPVGVAADWLTSVWGQNAAIYQCSPAAAIAEEAVEAWLLDLLNLPRECSVGLVTGATMAAFVSLAAARLDVLARHGYDLKQLGLQGAPLIRVYLSDDAHATNFSALRYLGFGETNFCRVPSDEQGLIKTTELARHMTADGPGPKIIIAQAGHINSGGFDDFPKIAEIARLHNAWVHADAAFGAWARVSPTKNALTLGFDLADSWSVDGHKWMQIPYDSGFAIVRNAEAHQRAMSIDAGYLNRDETDGRDPSSRNPELSRRARGFAAWAVLRHLGRQGVREIVERHCEAAAELTMKLADISGLTVINKPVLNQIILTSEDASDIELLAHSLNSEGAAFVKPAVWKGRTVLRLSIISGDCGKSQVANLAEQIKKAWASVKNP